MGSRLYRKSQTWSGMRCSAAERSAAEKWYLPLCLWVGTSLDGKFAARIRDLSVRCDFNSPLEAVGSCWKRITGRARRLKAAIRLPTIALSAWSRIDQARANVTRIATGNSFDSNFVDDACVWSFRERRHEAPLICALLERSHTFLPSSSRVDSSMQSRLCALRHLTVSISSRNYLGVIIFKQHELSRRLRRAVRSRGASVSAYAHVRKNISRANQEEKYTYERRSFAAELV